jgi:hypothetical protein
MAMPYDPPMVVIIGTSPPFARYLGPELKGTQLALLEIMLHCSTPEVCSSSPVGTTERSYDSRGAVEV